MQITPQLLGIFVNIYGSEDAVSISKVLLVALVGFVTVVTLLSIIALFIKFIAFVFAKVTGKKSVPAPAAKPASVQTAGKTAKTLRSEVKLIDVDEPTAAVIMALVSHNSGIPLERLDFKSIKPLEDK